MNLKKKNLNHFVRILSVSSALCLDSLYYRKLTLSSFNFMKVKSKKLVIFNFFKKSLIVEFFGWQISVFRRRTPPLLLLLRDSSFCGCMDCLLLFRIVYFDLRLEISNYENKPSEIRPFSFIFGSGHCVQSFQS